MTASPLAGVDPPAQQAPSLLAKGRLRAPSLAPPLYTHYWPPVPDHASIDPDLTEFIDASVDEQRRRLADSRADPEAHGRVLHGYLGSLYADSFGYRDSPVAADDHAELARFRARLQLERELLEHWVDSAPLPDPRDQICVADYLDHLAADNPGVNHPLFAYLRDHASRAQMELFLQCELIRKGVGAARAPFSWSVCRECRRLSPPPTCGMSAVAANSRTFTPTGCDVCSKRRTAGTVSIPTESGIRGSPRSRRTYSPRCSPVRHASRWPTVASSSSRAGWNHTSGRSSRA